MRLILVLAIILGMIYYLTLDGEQFNYSIKTLSSTKASQRAPSKKPFRFKGYTVEPLADFILKGRVLSRKNYSSGEEAELSPVDFAMGWGNMAHNDIIEQIDISQRGRWYYWRTENSPPIPFREIETHSANMHMIPANDQVESSLNKVEENHIINLQGYLVECTKPNWKWRSSTSRTDTGGGACEVIFVTKIKIIPPVKQ